jgi:hypothetical protein
MKKIYSVIIKGRTLESRDLKELMARAVVAKRNSEQKSYYQDRYCEPVLLDHALAFSACANGPSSRN